MSINTTNTNTVSSDSAKFPELTSEALLAILKKLEAKKFISDLEQKEDEIVSFTVDEKSGAALIYDSDWKGLEKVFNDQMPWVKSRAIKVQQNRLFEKGTVRCVRAATTHEQGIIASEKEVRVLTFDSLMDGIASFDEFKEETKKWRDLNGDGLAKEITDYVNKDIQIWGMFPLGEKDYVHYSLNPKCVEHYRILLKELLLRLAQHPIGRQTVAAALCINQTILKDLPMGFGIEPNIKFKGEYEFNAAYSDCHYLAFKPSALSSIRLLKHELGHLICCAAGFNKRLASLTQQKFILDLLCGKDSFEACVTNYKKFIHEDPAVSLGNPKGKEGIQLPSKFTEKAWGTLRTKSCIKDENNQEKVIENYYDFRDISQYLLPKIHFSNSAEMLNIIGLGEIGYWDTKWNDFILINHLSDFDFLETVRWGHNQGDYLKELLEDVQAERKLWENAEKTVVGLSKLGLNQTGPNEVCFKTLCQLHGRSESTSYIDDRNLSFEEYKKAFEGNIRKIDTQKV